MVLQCAPDQVISVPRLSHFLTAIDEGRVMTLGQLIASECAEPYYGPRAYNEQLYHFFLWLHRQRNYLPQVWELLRDWIARRLTAPNELAHELERVFGASIEEIDKTFVAWCRQELANLETGSRNGHAGSP
jgi:hypothetical protein